MDKSLSDQIVPVISRCANSQNKVNADDFSSNNPFHLQIEKLSRRILSLILLQAEKFLRHKHNQHV